MFVSVRFISSNLIGPNYFSKRILSLKMKMAYVVYKKLRILSSNFPPV